MPSDIALVRLVLLVIAASGIPANTIDLVDDNGFAVNPIRRFQEVAMDRLGATHKQAALACMTWVRCGRPLTVDAI